MIGPLKHIAVEAAVFGLAIVTAVEIANGRAGFRITYADKFAGDRATG